MGRPKSRQWRFQDAQAFEMSVGTWRWPSWRTGSNPVMVTEASPYNFSGNGACSGSFGIGHPIIIVQALGHPDRVDSLRRTQLVERESTWCLRSEALRPCGCRFESCRRRRASERRPFSQMGSPKWHPAPSVYGRWI